MRRLILLGFVVAIAIPATAAHRLSVVQLEEALTADDATHRPDADVAHQVGSFEMTERLSEADLGRLAAKLHLGPRTALALQLLADQSAFLDPPASELPATAPPDEAGQLRMMDAAQAYAERTWSRMPNFFVTRVTHRFDDSPHVITEGGWPVSVGLLPSGTSTRQITFRDGREVQDASAVNVADQKADEELGLRSWGEFGPAVTVVLADISKQKVTFSHWENTETGLAAVFRYEVPRETSHYAVSFCCVINEQVIGRTQFGYSGNNRTAQQMSNIPREKQLKTYNEKPGYHGTISIDPGSGAIMRLTIQADLSSGDPLRRAETMVQYGPVTIGDQRFICPQRSLAISLESTEASGAARIHSADGTSPWRGSPGHSEKVNILLVNETSFADYHRLGTSMRILTDATGTETASSNPPATATPSSSPGSPQQPDHSLSAGDALAANETRESAAGPPNAPPPTTTSNVLPTPPTPAAPVIPEMTMSAASGVPDQPANPLLPSEGGYSLKVTSRSVDVGLVALDKKGHPVTDLKAADVEVYDNGHKQEIRSFNLLNNEATSAPTQIADATDTEEQPQGLSNRAVDPAPLAATPQAASAGATVLLMDESHIAWSDMSYARGQILKFLASLKPGERIGLYSMNGLGFRVLAEITTNHSALVARMQKFMPSAQSAAQAQEEETRNRQHFDEVHNVADLNSVNGNHTDVPDFMSPIDPQLLTMGDDPVRSSFIVLTQVARHLSAIPGQKKLVWVSSDNVFADWRDQAVGIEKSPKPVEAYAMHAQEAMNDAHAAVYPFDVSQLEGGAISADLQHQNVQLGQAAAENATLSGGPSVSRNTGPGRIEAGMSQDLHPVQGPVRQVATATGGRVIRRAGDLAGLLDGVLADEHATYMLSFSPQGPADNQYHAISLKLSGRRGLNLSYRTEYFFDKEPESLRERFQQAVWRPMDVSEIAVTARARAANGGVNIKIDIATGDLGLREQAGRWMDKLDIFFIQRDDAGLRAQLEGQTLGLKLRNATYQRLLPAGVPFERFAELKPETGSMRILVVDENSGRMGSITIPRTTMESTQ